MKKNNYQSMQRNTLLFLIFTGLIAGILIAGCTSAQANDPIVGTWLGTTSGSYVIFTENGQFIIHNNGDADIHSNWTKTQNGDYQTTSASGEILTFSYNASGDYIVYAGLPGTHLSRFSAQGTAVPTASVATSVMTPIQQLAVSATTALTVFPTTSVSQDPIIGTYTCDAGAAGYGQVTFNADGTFVEYFNLAGEAPVQATGTWQYNNGVYLTALTTGATNVWVITPSGAVKDENALIYIPGTEHGKVQVTQTTSGTNSKSLSYSGTGDDIRSFSVTNGGGFVVTGSNSGDSNFIVHITDSGGNVKEFVFNEIGPYSGKKIIHLSAGSYYLDVKAEGGWTITLTGS